MRIQEYSKICVKDLKNVVIHSRYILHHNFNNLNRICCLIRKFYRALCSELLVMFLKCFHFENNFKAFVYLCKSEWSNSHLWNRRFCQLIRKVYELTLVAKYNTLYDLRFKWGWLLFFHFPLWPIYFSFFFVIFWFF